MRQSLNKEKKVRPLTKSQCLKRKGYLSVRGKEFKGTHVHSIVRKKKLKDEKFAREYSEQWLDFSFKVVVKTLVNKFED